MCELTLSAPEVNKCKPVYTTIDYLIHQLNKSKCVESFSYKTELYGTRTILVDVKLGNYNNVNEILSKQKMFNYTINLMK
jgi:hypothetical protein